MHLEGAKVLVTGGRGFLGQHVVRELEKYRPKKLVIPSHISMDLRERRDCRWAISQVNPDVIIHLAAVCGGIGANRENPGKFFYDNIKMGIELMDEAREQNIPKFVQVGTVCAYPKFCPTPFKEDTLWDGYPEETNAPYGVAKKALLVMAQAYREQYGMNAIYLLPVNLYGPGDNFDPNSSHVIPALIKKCLDGRRDSAKSIQVWGTGNAYREFMHVRDCARAICLATERYDKPAPVNLGTNSEISIKSLVELIAYECGYYGELVWDAGKPDGQPNRRLDTSRAKEEFGFEAGIGLVDGIRETVAWYTRKIETSHSN